MKKQLPSLSNRILLFFYPIPVVVLFIFLGHSYQQNKEFITESESQKLLAIGRTLVTQISGDQHQRIDEKYAQKDFSKTPADYLEAAKALLTAKKQNQLNTDIYTLVLSPDMIEKIEAKPNEFHKDGTDFLLISSMKPYFRHSYDYKPEMKKAFFEGEETILEPYKSDNGSWISVLLPIRNSYGQIVGILELDKKLNELYSAQLAVLRNNAIWVSIILLIAYFISKQVSKGVLSPIEELKKATEALVRGNYSEPIDVHACSAEISSMTAVIEDMRLQTFDAFVRMKKLDKMKDDCLGLLNHELRTPLYFIASGVEVLKMEESDQDPKETIDIIEDGVNRLNTLAQQISSTSSLSFKQENLIKDSHSLFSLCSTVEGFLGEELDKKQIVVHHNFEDEDRVFCDEILFCELLNKIYKNWICFTPNSEVFIDYNDNNSCSQIIFTDQGCGIPEDKIEDIFSPFVIGGNILNHSEGNGLGLSIAQSIAEAHNGSMTVVNNSPGAGCTFTVNIPKKTKLKRPA